MGLNKHIALLRLPTSGRLLTHSMPTGTELLRQLQQRRSCLSTLDSGDATTATTLPIQAVPKALHSAPIRAPLVAPSVEDQWITDENGRRHRVRNHDGSPAAVADAPSQRANAEADGLAAVSSQQGAQLIRGAEGEGWQIVRQHSTEFACWVVIGGRVLDATSYLGHHPGGSMIIQRLAGKDATKAYERARHSRAADLKLHDFDIGALTDVKRLSRAAQEARERRDRLEAAAAYL